MSMLKFIYGLFLVSTVFSSPAVAQNHPNVLFILIDDFGWKDVGYNGSTFYETPRIDSLARQWMRFDHCYTPSPMCSPTRVSILTGKNPARHGVTQWLAGRDTFYGREGETPRVYCPVPQSSGIKDSEVTLGEAFQEAGYETAFYGKWHMGKLKATGGPKNHGYDSQLAVIEENNCTMFYPFGNKKYFPEATPGDNFTDKLTDAAIEFVTADRDQPFYLHLSHFAMHYPIASKPELRAKFEVKRKALPLLEQDRMLDDYSHQPHRMRQDDPEYAGELATLDKNIGRLVDALKAAGRYENTIIVLTGDNGGRATMNLLHSTSLQPIRGGKTFLFEGGLRTPLLIYWPDHTKPGMQSNVPVTSMDLYPTLLDMAGLPQKGEQHIDGVSLVPLVRGEQIQRDTLYWHFPHYQGEGAYPASAIRKGDYKLIVNYHHHDSLLFDVVNDPDETKNLAAAMPEKTEALRKQLMVYLQETGAHIPQTLTK